MSDLVRQVLGELTQAPDLLDTTELLRADLFPAGRERETFAAISKLWEEERPSRIDLVLLADRLGGNGAGPYVASLVDGLPKPDRHAFVSRVVELRKRAISKAVLAKIERQARTGEFDLGEIRGLLR